VDALMFEIGDDAIADRLRARRAAERSGKAHAATEPCDADRGIRGAAAAGDDELRGGDLLAGEGKALDPHDDVLDRDPGAEDRSLIGGGHRLRPRPSRG